MTKTKLYVTTLYIAQRPPSERSLYIMIGTKFGYHVAASYVILLNEVFFDAHRAHNEKSFKSVGSHAGGFPFQAHSTKTAFGAVFVLCAWNQI